MALDQQLARDMEMVDIGQQWRYDFVDMIVCDISVAEELHVSEKKNFQEDN